MRFCGRFIFSLVLMLAAFCGTGLYAQNRITFRNLKKATIMNALRSDAEVRGDSVGFMYHPEAKMDQLESGFIVLREVIPFTVKTKSFVYIYLEGETGTADCNELCTRYSYVAEKKGKHWVITDSLIGDCRDKVPHGWDSVSLSQAGPYTIVKRTVERGICGGKLLGVTSFLFILDGSRFAGADEFITHVSNEAAGYCHYPVPEDEDEYTPQFLKNWKCDCRSMSAFTRVEYLPAGILKIRIESADTVWAGDRCETFEACTQSEIWSYCPRFSMLTESHGDCRYEDGIHISDETFLEEAGKLLNQD